MSIIKLITLLILSLLLSNQVQALEANTEQVSIYKLGPGDRISVRVFGEPDLSIPDVALSDSGSFMFPSIGEISVLNKNLHEVEDIITNRLQGRILVNPKVYVSVNEYRPFFISGAVKRPGDISYQPGLTISKAVAMAGGFTEVANVKEIYLYLPNNKKILIEDNYNVKPGDSITVNEYEPIYVNGMVKNGGGSYPYPRSGLNVRKAISLAGGFHERANVKKIYIIRNNDPRQLPVLVNLNDKVEPGDTITIEESFF